MSTEPIGFKAFWEAYIECALWASTDDDGENLDDYTIDDIDPASLAKLREYALDFFTANRELFGLHYDQAGHDFWLTRNGHGAGFWDRGNLYLDEETGEDNGRKLTDAAHAYDGCDLYIGDDGKIYASE